MRWNMLRPTTRFRDIVPHRFQKQNFHFKRGGGWDWHEEPWLMLYKYVQRWSASPPHYNIHLFLCLELLSHYSCHALHLHTVGLHNPILADFFKVLAQAFEFSSCWNACANSMWSSFKEKCRSCLHCWFTAQILQKVPESNLLSVWNLDLIFSPRLNLWFIFYS